MMRFKLLSLFLLIGFIPTLSAAEIRIGAASNLRFVLPELITDFEQKTGHQVQVSFAASGTLSSQIQHGAPFDVFMSASPDYISRLQKYDLTRGDAVEYAQAQLALFANSHSALQPDSNLNSIKHALENNTLNKLVIANPQHAPYGQLAKQLLQQHGLWQQVQTHLLLAENAAQSLQFSLSPQASVGFVPYTYVMQPTIANKGSAVRLAGHLVQQAVVLNHADGSAEQWLVYLLSLPAQTLLANHGFLMGNEVTK